MSTMAAGSGAAWWSALSGTLAVVGEKAGTLWESVADVVAPLAPAKETAEDGGGLRAGQEYGRGGHASSGTRVSGWLGGNARVAHGNARFAASSPDGVRAA
jgi:hypothetical protein